MDTTTLTQKVQSFLPFLDERQTRLYVASEAMAVGHGGIKLLSQISGVSASRIQRGIAELEAGVQVGDVKGNRRAGGGRKSYAESHPEMVKELLKLVDKETRGDPMSPLVWTAKSTRNLAEAMKSLGHSVSHDAVSDILREHGYSLQANVKTKEGNQHKDRDAQFVHINTQSETFMAQGVPVLSLDAKKKELIGEYKKAGKEWHKKGEPPNVKGHDFEDKQLGKALPYGILDVARNEGWVNVGQDHDTSEFAVNSLRFWFNSEERKAAYNGPQALYLCLDAGGSNNYRFRLWKSELAKFADEIGIPIHVSHLPPGTSKWNKIEHRLFSHITMNWRGRPLTSMDVVINTIKATTTRKGLTVQAHHDTGEYAKGKRITDDEFDKVKEQLVGDNFHPEWNYTVNPTR